MEKGGSGLLIREDMQMLGEVLSGRGDGGEIDQ